MEQDRARMHVSYLQTLDKRAIQIKYTTAQHIPLAKSAVESVVRTYLSRINLLR